MPHCEVRRRDKMTEEAIEEVEKSDFELAFNELAEARESPASTELPDEETAKEEDKAESALDTKSEPEDKNKEVEPAGDNPFEGWPTEAVHRYKSQLELSNKLQHQINSDSGRVSAFQKKVNDLEATIEQIKTDSSKEQPTEQQITDAMSGGDADWKEFSDDYPEVAAAIDKRFDAQQKDINSKLDTKQSEIDSKLDTTLAPVIEKQHRDEAIEAETATNESYAEVAKTYPTWQNVVQKQEYNDWYVSQSPGIQALGDSADVNDASTLIGLYDDYRVANGHPTMKADPEPDPGVTTEANELAERRKRQLEDGKTIPSKSARVDPDAESGEDEFERSFNAFAARKEAKNRR